MSRGNDACNHWRQLVSCKLDGEVTEFELIGLERHRAGCDDCAAWEREVGYLADALQRSERAQPAELVSVQLPRHRFGRFSTLAAASASIGAAALAAIAIGLPARGGPIGAEPAAGTSLGVSLAEPPPRSLVLVSLKRAQQLGGRPATTPPWHRPQGRP